MAGRTEIGSLVQHFQLISGQCIIQQLADPRSKNQTKNRKMRKSMAEKANQFSLAKRATQFA